MKSKLGEPYYAVMAFATRPGTRMECEDCDWQAVDRDTGILACLALEHSTQHPGHRLGFRADDCMLSADQIPSQKPAATEVP